MLRLVAVVCASVPILGLAVGLAAAEPAPLNSVPPLMKPPALDAAWARQLKVKAEPVPASELQPAIEQALNSAGNKRMTSEQKGLALKVPSSQVKGPIVLSARTPYHDDKTYLDFYPGQGNITLRSQANYAYLDSNGADNGPSFAPTVKLYFSTEPGRRYLLECVVDSSAATVTATAVSSDGLKMTTTLTPSDKTSLLQRFEPAPAARSILVKLGGDDDWTFRGCELSWTGP